MEAIYIIYVVLSFGSFSAGVGAALESFRQDDKVSITPITILLPTFYIGYYFFKILSSTPSMRFIYFLFEDLRKDKK